MTAKCKNCGKDFKTSPFYIKKGLRKFCSKECSSAWQSKFRVYKKGEESPGWKGGNKKSGSLQAHHIKQLSAILNDLGQDKAALHVVISSPDLWDLKNGITLCKACHKQEHKVKTC